MDIHDNSNLLGILQSVYDYCNRENLSYYEKGSTNEITFKQLMSYAQEMIDEKRFEQFILLSRKDYQKMELAKVNGSLPRFAGAGVTTAFIASAAFTQSITNPIGLAAYLAYGSAVRITPLLLAFINTRINYRRLKNHERNEYHFNKYFKGNYDSQFYALFAAAFALLLAYFLNRSNNDQLLSELKELISISDLNKEFSKNTDSEMIILGILLHEIVKHTTVDKKGKAKKKKGKVEEFFITNGYEMELRRVINEVSVKPNNLYLTDNQCKMLQDHIDGLIRYVHQVEPTAFKDDSVSITTLIKHQKGYHESLANELMSRIDNIKEWITENRGIYDKGFYSPSKIRYNIKSFFWEKENTILSDENNSKMPNIETALERLNKH